MTDTAGDCGTLLEELGVKSEKVLLLCPFDMGIDHECDKVFNATEQKIEVQKALELSAGQKAFSSPSASIHTLGQTAISPRHASHSVSLFNEYKSWMSIRGIKHAGFKCFCPIWFGRIAEMSKKCTRQQSVIDFNSKCHQT